MSTRVIPCLSLLLLLSVPPARAEEVETVSAVDLERYSGKWFEIARLPNRFQKDCVGATAEYGLPVDRKVKVVNTCYREDGTLRDIEGSAEVVDDSGAKLVVRFDNLFFKLFGWLIKPNYWVLELAEDYSWAVVGTPDRKNLWVLYRERVMDPSLYAAVMARVAAQGFDIDQIVRTQVPLAAPTEH